MNEVLIAELEQWIADLQSGMAQAQFRPRAVTTEGRSEVGPEEPIA